MENPNLRKQGFQRESSDQIRDRIERHMHALFPGRGGYPLTLVLPIIHALHRRDGGEVAPMNVVAAISALIAKQCRETPTGAYIRGHSRNTKKLLELHSRLMWLIDGPTDVPTLRPKWSNHSRDYDSDYDYEP